MTTNEMKTKHLEPPAVDASVAHAADGSMVLAPVNLDPKRLPPKSVVVVSVPR